VQASHAWRGGSAAFAVTRAGARFAFAIAINPAVAAATAGINDEHYLPVHYPGAVTDPTPDS
jgi:hypothetical protein